MNEITQADTHIISMTVAAFKTSQEQSRMEERDRIVALIRAVSDELGDELADRIEEGEHLK